MTKKNSKAKRWLKSLKNRFTRTKDDYAALRQHLREAQKKDVISLDALMMIEGVFQVSEMRVRDIMVPRAHLVVIQEDLIVADMLKIVADSGHSRFPVIDESVDEVIGILLAKDLTRYQTKKSRSSFELKDILRSAVFVPESKRLNVLLKDFRKSRNHMAIVIDEYGGVSGLVTIEDVLEEIVGEIDDEHDAADAVNIRRSGRQRYNVHGLTPLDEFNEYFESNLTSDKFETIAGLVTSELGHLPERGEEVSIGLFHFSIVSANSRRINTMQVSILSESDSKSDEEGTTKTQEDKFQEESSQENASIETADAGAKASSKSE